MAAHCCRDGPALLKDAGFAAAEGGRFAILDEIHLPGTLAAKRRMA
jgi:hypothetical protein